LAFDRAGRSRAASRAMQAITTSNSTREKPYLFCRLACLREKTAPGTSWIPVLQTMLAFDRAVTNNGHYSFKSPLSRPILGDLSPTFHRTPILSRHFRCNGKRLVGALDYRRSPFRPSKNCSNSRNNAFGQGQTGVPQHVRLQTAGPCFSVFHCRDGPHQPTVDWGWMRSRTGL
jgi:hypothetical protein